MAMNTSDTNAGPTIFFHPLQIKANSGIAAGFSTGVFIS